MFWLRNKKNNFDYTLKCLSYFCHCILLFICLCGFRYNFSGIIGGYKLHVQRMRLHSFQSNRPAFFFSRLNRTVLTKTFRRSTEFSHRVIFTYYTQKTQDGLVSMGYNLEIFSKFVIVHS